MEELLNPVQEETLEVVDVQFRPGQKVYYFDPNGEKFAPGDHVIMDTARGVEFGLCAAGNHKINTKDAVAPLRKILRRATAQDEKINEENRARERRAFEVCAQKIQSHGLDMQLVSAECAFDGSKILFYFTADERVDFRSLSRIWRACSIPASSCGRSASGTRQRWWEAWVSAAVPSAAPAS